jgi:hypothetical protein
MPRLKGKSDKEIVQSRAIEILRQEKYKRGIQFLDLVKKTKNAVEEKDAKDIKDNPVKTYLQGLPKDKPDEVYRPDWGLFRHKSFETEQEKSEETVTQPTTVEVSEEEEEKEEKVFYESFAHKLKEWRECTKSQMVGGKKFGEKWTTPDVVGIYKTSDHALIKSDTLIVSAEIKTSTSTQELVTAFGQACVYKIFSHKVYIVIPSDTPSAFLSKMDALCSILGIGLVVFKKDEPDNPDYQIRIKAIRTEPDSYYTNYYMQKLEEEPLFSD